MTAWQGRNAARRWRALVAMAQAAEAPLGLGDGFARAVGVTGLRLMAYKDEYEVARLHRAPGFRAALAATFDGGGRPRVHLAPPLLPLGRDGRTGRPRKIALGRSADLAFAVLVRLKWLRGTPFDPFGHTAERRAERRLARDFATLVARLSAGLTPETHARAVAIAELGQSVRGFGPVKAAAIARYEAALAEGLAQ
jgi:indolepyruvate ferredoxin oxidoreductase